MLHEASTFQQVINNRTFRLISVDPYPDGIQILEKKDYVITLVIE